MLQLQQMQNQIKEQQLQLQQNQNTAEAASPNQTQGAFSNNQHQISLPPMPSGNSLTMSTFNTPMQPPISPINPGQE